MGKEAGRGWSEGVWLLKPHLPCSMVVTAVAVQLSLKWPRPQLCTPSHIHLWMTKMCYIDQKHQAVNTLFSVVNLGILTWGSMGIDSLLESASSDQSMNCSLSHSCFGFIREISRLIHTDLNRGNIQTLASRPIYTTVAVKPFKLYCLSAGLYPGNPTYHYGLCSETLHHIAVHLYINADSATACCHYIYIYALLSKMTFSALQHVHFTQYVLSWNQTNHFLWCYHNIPPN